MQKKEILLCAMVLVVTGLIGSAGGVELTPKERLGKQIFFDENLSLNGNQSCASCHGPVAGWTGPVATVNVGGAVYEGSVLGRFGNRKPPSAAYATQSPIFYFQGHPHELFVGGNFWDGRATGERLGNPAADQAQGPFLNPVEQALDTSGDVVSRVCSSSYAELFTNVWGSAACDPANTDMAYDNIALSVAAYEASAEVNAFTSKFDYVKNGMAKFTKQEQKGFALFKGKGKCRLCHPVNGKLPLFTDFSYDNLGIPKNPDNPWYDMPAEYNPDGNGWVDPGLGGFLASRVDYQEYAEENLGKHKVPTLRNVDKRPSTDFVKAFGHNGYFKSLEEIVHFYNTRDTLGDCAAEASPAPGGNCWPAPEVAENLNTDELGDLGLSTEEEEAIVAFLKTLSDGYVP